MVAAPRLIGLLVVVCAAFVLPTSASAAQTPAPRLLAAHSLEAELAAQMNAARRSHGLSTLSVHWRLRRAAKDHAVNMARNGYFAHAWSNGSPFSSWIRRYWPGPSRYRSWRVGENLYWQGPTTNAETVIRAWLNSPTHRHNLLKREWRSVGVGVVRVVNPIRAYRGVPTAFIVAAEYGVINR